MHRHHDDVPVRFSFCPPQQVPKKKTQRHIRSTEAAGAIAEEMMAVAETAVAWGVSKAPSLAKMLEFSLNHLEPKLNSLLEDLIVYPSAGSMVNPQKQSLRGRQLGVT